MDALSDNESPKRRAVFDELPISIFSRFDEIFHELVPRFQVVEHSV